MEGKFIGNGDLYWDDESVTGLTVEGTVKNYISTILDKLGVEDRLQAALRGREMGIL